MRWTWERTGIDLRTRGWVSSGNGGLSWIWKPRTITDTGMEDSDRSEKRMGADPGMKDLAGSGNRIITDTGTEDRNEMDLGMENKG